MVHSYLGTQTLLQTEARSELLLTMEPCLRDKVDRSDGDHTGFFDVNLKGPGGRHAVVEEEGS